MEGNWLQAPQSLVSPQGRAGGLPGASPRRGAQISREEAGRPLPEKRRCSLTVGTPEAPPDLGPGGAFCRKACFPSLRAFSPETSVGTSASPHTKLPIAGAARCHHFHSAASENQGFLSWPKDFDPDITRKLRMEET